MNDAVVDEDTVVDEGPTTDPGTGRGPAPRSMRALVVSGGVLAMLLLGASLGMLVQLPGRGLAQPTANSVDVGFSQDMSVHHRQAVLMAGLAREHSDDLAIRSLAFDIERTQLEQVGRMQGWLSLWNAGALPVGPHMTWMTDAATMRGMAHGATGSAGVTTMPGMASPADLDRLGSASGTEFDVLFLQLMLRHHQGGTPMAQYAAQHAEAAQVRNLAEKIVISQSSESEYLADLLTQRGGQPLPPPT